ncbi:MAG TPA: hypothetical protein VF582_02195 [Allosphingosinicella sp.]|jgi:hypothetical protein
MALQWTSLISPALGALVGLAAVWLASFLTSLRTHKDRIWNRKSEAYAVIFEALYDMQTWFDENLDDEMLRRDVDAQTQERRNASYRAAKDRLFRTLAREEWMLPNDVTLQFATLRSTLEAHYASWFEDLDTGAGAVHKTKKKLIEFARIDMRG